jgi:hypothetical protein
MWFSIYPGIAWILKLPFLVIIKCDLVEMYKSFMHLLRWKSLLISCDLFYRIFVYQSTK